MDPVALVIVDVQNAIDDPRWGPRNNPDAEQRIADMLDAWRTRGWPVLHVRHDSSEADSPYRPGQAGNDFKTEVAPTGDEVVVTKTANSAFIGTDLAERLGRLGCDAVLFAGVLTNNSLEATVRMSGNLGYRTYVASDGSWAVDTTDLRGTEWSADDVHALSLANMNDEYATVIASNEAIALTRS